MERLDRGTSHDKWSALPKRGTGRRAPFWLIAAAFLLAHCGDPTAPTPPGGSGELFFIDDGCTCSPPDPTPIAIYVDGKVGGLLPALGHLAIALRPGPHTWSFVSADDPNATHVTISIGQVVTVHLETDENCGDFFTVVGTNVPNECPTPNPAPS